jgi:hypothetical protein
MFDGTFLITLLIILAGVMVGSYLNGQRKDRGLAAFEGYEVTLERLDGRLIWGKMNLETTGIELEYAADVQDEQHIETSYVLYRDEFPHIQAIYRYCDEMNTKQWERREREMERAFHPGFWQRLRRRSRNFMNLASESLSQAIGVVVGQVRPRAGRYITDASASYLGDLGKNIVGYVGTKYDPLLERYVGTQVVVEVTEGGTVYEHVGILKDYTADFLVILDVHYPNQSAFRLKGQQASLENRSLKLVRDGDSLTVKNIGQDSLFLQRLAAGDQIQPINAVLDKDDELVLHLPPGVSDADAELTAKVVRYLDWILPRSHALIRHKAERYDPDQVFDIGFVLRLDRHTDEEQPLREVLKANPDDAPSAVALGQILFQAGKLDEAEDWFCYALDRRQHLPDGGKLAERQLRYIGLKQAEHKHRLSRSYASPCSQDSSG